MKELLLDANILVRFLVQDDPRHSPAATRLFEKAERGEFLLHIEPMVVAETIYVLTGVYGRARAHVTGALLALLQNPGVQAGDGETIADALRRFVATNVDFADAYLAARSIKLRCPVASFDRDFDKFLDVQRFDPASK